MHLREDGSAYIDSEPTIPDQLSVPPADVGVGDAVSIAMGRGHACAARTDGSVWCWGSNLYGQLGDGTIVDRSRPAAVLGISDVIQVTAGWAHTCALRKTGTIACWGNTERGEVGTFATDWIAEPQQVVWP